MEYETRIILPARKSIVIASYVGCIVLFTIMSDFFSRSMSDPYMIMISAFWVFMFCYFSRRISISEKKIQILLFGRWPIRTIKREKLACVEIVAYRGQFMALFEMNGCERFDNSGFFNVSDYGIFNLFKVVEYTIPKGKEEYVLSLLKSMYDVYISEVSNPYNQY